MPEVVAHELRPMLYTPDGIDAAAAAADAGGAPIAVHLKVDTGMHRVGADPDDAVALAERCSAAARRCGSKGCATHLAVADEPDDPSTAEQLDRFDAALAALARHGIERARSSTPPTPPGPSPIRRRALRPRAGRASPSTASPRRRAWRRIARRARARAWR